MATEVTGADIRGRAVPARGSGSAVAARVRRAPDWSVAATVGLLTALLGVIPQWRGTFFYYVGDQHDQFGPLWHLLGERLRDGRWTGMDPAGWMGGNYAAEGLDGIWNPVVLANDLLVSTFDDLSRATFVVAVEFLGLLAAGVFLLARAYGAARVPSVAVAIAAPFAGFSLWYEAAGWPMGLMAFTWTTHFWWSARRHALGRLNPFVPFLFGALAVTTGNPYGALGVVAVLAALAVELLLAGRFRRLAHLVLVGACAGAPALLVYLPLLGVGAVTNRATLAGLGNDTFLVPRVGDLVAGSSVSYLPAITNWNGALLEQIPSTYLAWFVLPLLPWLRWRAGLARLGGRASASLWLVTGGYLLATLGPSNLWLFRWPVRLVEYLYLAVLVIFAVVLSAGPATDRVQLRATLSGGIALTGAYLAWAVRPRGLYVAHVAGLVLVAGLVALGVRAWLRRGMPALGAVLVVGTGCVLTLQSSVFPAALPGTGAASTSTVWPAYDLTRMRAGTAVYRGTVLQVATLAYATSAQMQSGELLFGNLPRAAGVSSVVSYTGLGFEDFQHTLCMDYRGITCPEAFDRLWAPAGPTVDAPLVDALRVSTVVVQRALRPDVAGLRPPPGWHVALHDDVRIVWIRDRPLPDTGRVSWVSPGLRLHNDDATPQRESVQYTGATAGRLLFARLAWPGYTATVDGRPAQVRAGPAGLLMVPVPAGTHSVAVSYRPPGVGVGSLAAGAAVLVALVHAVGWAATAHRRRALPGAR